MAPLADPVQSLLITTVFGFLTTILTLMYQGWNSGRQRRWDREDLARKTEEARATLATLTEKTRQELAERTEQSRLELAQLVRTAATDVQRKTDTAHNATDAHVTRVASEIKARVEKVGELANVAYKEANDVNRKILELHEAGHATNARLEVLQAQSTSEKLTSIDQVGKDTNEQVHLMKEKIG